MSEQLTDKFPLLKILNPVFSLCEKVVVRKSLAVVAVCQALEERVRLIDSSKKILRLEDVSLVDSAGCGNESLRDIAGRENRIVLYVGNLESYQGIDLLLEGIAIASGAIENLVLMVIGGNENHIQKYRSRAEELAISGQVFFIGPRPLENLGGYLAQADMLVSPRIEGDNTPMKIYSYMDSGVPVLATNIRSHTQVLDQNTAFLANPDKDSFGEMMVEGLRNTHHASAVAQEAKKRVAEKYSRKAFSSKLTDFYAEISHVRNMRI